MSRAQRLRVEGLEQREVPADLTYALQLTGLPADVVTRVASNALGELYVTGAFSGTIDLDPSATAKHELTAAGGSDVFVAKYSTTGKFVWARTLDGLADETATEIALDGMSNVYVVGTFEGATDFNPDPLATVVGTAAAGGSAYLWKLDFNGNFFMARTVEGVSTATGVAVDTAGNIVVGGSFWGTADFSATETPLSLTTASSTGSGFVWRLNQPGVTVWAKPFHTTGELETTSVFIDGTGFAYLSGGFTGTADLDPGDATKALVAGGTAWTPFVVKLNGQGNYVWGKAIRPIAPTVSADNRITGLGVDGIGNVFAAGTLAGSMDFDPGASNSILTSASAETDAFVWKLDSNGNFVYARRFGGVNAETVNDMYADRFGFVFVTGNFTGVADFDPSNGVYNLISGTGAADTYVVKINRVGNLGYARAIGGGLSTTRSSGIFADGAGNIYLSGGFSGRADFEPQNGVNARNGGLGAGFIAKFFHTNESARLALNRPPIKLSAGGPYVIDEGKGLALKATAVDPEGLPLTFTWDLNGDGLYGDAIGHKVTLTYPQLQALGGLADGTDVAKTIRMRVHDGLNLPIEASTTLTIKNVPPVTKIIAPATAPEGVRPLVNFKVIKDVNKDLKAGHRASWDFNGDGGWDLGDGLTYAGSVVGAVKVPAAFVMDSGPLLVRVRVFDKDGGFSDSEATIVLTEVAPKASFGIEGLARVGVPTTFKFSNVLDSASDMLAGFTYEFDLNNDGTYETTSLTPQATGTFGAVGSYTVNGRITDQDGMSTTYSSIVNVTF